MKFIVSRASVWDGSQPCEEAYIDFITNVDERCVSDPSKLEGIDKNNWYNKGKNHRILPNGNIARDNVNGEAKVWCINITTLEELIEFKKKYGSIIVQTCYENDDYDEIKIYDYYVE